MDALMIKSIDISYKIMSWFLVNKLNSNKNNYMKLIGCIFISVFVFCNAFSQNIHLLFESIPFPSSSCEEAFQSAELEWEAMTLDNDSIFNRVKSWAPGGALKSFSIKLDKLLANIERASENNSFSLSTPPTIDKEVMKSIEQLIKVRESISNVWNSYREPFVNANSNFIVPNELDNGCGQMQFSLKSLNAVSKNMAEQLNSFKSGIDASMIDFQHRYDEINKIKHPMVNNQILEEMTSLLNMLNEISNALNFHYKNMVETRMAWNNAFCK